MSFLELRTLYEEFLKRCKEAGVDPKTIDFEMIIDSDLSYYENLTRLETEIVGLIPTPVEIEELEYYKKRVEELEKRIREMERVVPIEEIDKLRREVKKWKERYEKAKKAIREVKATPGLTEEDVARIVRETIKEITLPLGKVLKNIGERIKKLEERAVPPEVVPVTVEEAYEEWGPPPPFNPREIPPSGSQITNYIKDILSLMHVKAREFGKEVEELTDEEIESILRQLRPSFPRQVAYFRWWRARLPAWREYWRRFFV